MAAAEPSSGAIAPGLPSDSGESSSEDERASFIRSRGIQGFVPPEPHQLAAFIQQHNSAISMDNLFIDKKRKHGQLRTIDPALLRTRLASFLALPPTALLRVTVWPSPGV